MDDLFGRVGVEGAWQVTDLATGATLGAHVDDALPIVSISKVAATLVAFRLADHGDLDLRSSITLSPDGRSAGTTGISAMCDPVTISLRDAAYLALTISDNAAGDALFDAVGSVTMAEELESLGMGAIHVREPMRDLYDRLTLDVATAFDADTTNTATPRALTRMLELVWSDLAASPASCATIRNLMHRQVWNQRLAGAFPATDITVAGKTATAGAMRHEIGVVTYPGPRHYLVAILTHRLTDADDHRIDAAIGEVARRAIHQLRRHR